MIGVKILNYPDIVILGLRYLWSIIETSRISFNNHLLLVLGLTIAVKIHATGVVNTVIKWLQSNTGTSYLLLLIILIFIIGIYL